MSTEDLFSQRERLTPAKLGLLQKRLLALLPRLFQAFLE